MRHLAVDVARQLDEARLDARLLGLPRKMSQIVISNAGRGGRRKLPWAFTEHGVAMLSSILRSKRAVQVNVAIVRTFVKLREMLATNEELARKVAQHDRQIAVLFDQVQKMLAPVPTKKNPIGYI
jgi:hypothetical protein